MPWWSKASTALTTPLGVESISASFAASRIAEYPVKLETETIGYMKSNVQISGDRIGGISLKRQLATKSRYFRISSKGQVKSGALEVIPSYYNHLPVLENDTTINAGSTTTQDKINRFAEKTGLHLKNENGMNGLYQIIYGLADGDFGKTEPMVTVNNLAATTSLATGKKNAMDESKRIQDVILNAAIDEKNAAVAAAAAAPPPAQADPNVAALADKYGAANIADGAAAIAVLTAVNDLANNAAGTAGQALAAAEIAAIVDIIANKRAAAETAASMNVSADTTALANKYGNAINDYNDANRALTSLNGLATGGNADGQGLAATDIATIVQLIETRRAAAAAAAAPAAAAADPNVATLEQAYHSMDAGNFIEVLGNLITMASSNKLAKDSIDKIVEEARKEIPILTDAVKIIAFLRSVIITNNICSNPMFTEDPKNPIIALLFMVYVDKIDVHFIKKRSTPVPFRKTTVIGDTHYISKSAKDILTFNYSMARDGVDKSAMLEILNLICLPVSFKISDTTSTNATTYGFRNRHTAAATRPYENVSITPIYPFTADNGEINLILGRATAKQEAVEASAKFNNAPTIAKLTDLHGLLCNKTPVILTSGNGSPCEAIQQNINKLQSGQAGGRRSRKRMNKNKRASSRHSRRHMHGHNSRKRYSAGSKSKSGTKSKSASNRRRNQKQ